MEHNLSKKQIIFSTLNCIFGKSTLILKLKTNWKKLSAYLVWCTAFTRQIYIILHIITYIYIYITHHSHSGVESSSIIYNYYYNSSILYSVGTFCCHDKWCTIIIVQLLCSQLVLLFFLKLIYTPSITW